MEERSFQFTVCLEHAHPASLYNPGQPGQGMTAPAVDWAFLHSLSIKAIPHLYAYRPTWEGQLLKWSSFFPVTLICSKLTVNANTNTKQLLIIKVTVLFYVLICNVRITVQNKQFMFLKGIKIKVLYTCIYIYTSVGINYPHKQKQGVFERLVMNYGCFW